MTLGERAMWIAVGSAGGGCLTIGVITGLEHALHTSQLLGAGAGFFLGVGSSLLGGLAGRAATQ